MIDTKKNARQKKIESTHISIGVTQIMKLPVILYYQACPLEHQLTLPCPRISASKIVINLKPDIIACFSSFFVRN